MVQNKPHFKPIQFKSKHLDVSPREIILSQDEVIQCHILSQGHPAGVDLKNPPLCLLIWQWELNLPIYPSWWGGVGGRDLIS